MDAPAFDPSQPYQAEASAPPFDPNKPFDVASSGPGIPGPIKAAGSGFAHGILGVLGAPGDISAAVSSAADYIANQLGVPADKYNAVKQIVSNAFQQTPGIGAFVNAPTSADLQSKVAAVTGPLYKPQNKTEEYISSVASMTPAIVAGPGGLARRAVSQVLIPGVTSQAAGDIPAVKGTAAEPFVRAGAAMLSPSAAERMVTPITTAPTRAQAARILEKEGVDISAGQKTGSKFLRKQEEELGGATTENLAERQSEQFTSAVLKRVGEDAPRATSDVMNNAFDRIGGQMNKLAASNTLTVDTKLTNDLKAAQAEYNRLISPNNRAPIVDEVVNDILKPVASGLSGGTIAGDQYQAIRMQLGKDARAVKNDPHLQDTLYTIQRAVDDAAERAISAQNPDMLGEWRQARQEYKNLLTVEKAINYQGEAANSGIVTPQNLARAVKAMGGGRDYSRGRTDLSVLAKAGSEVMAPLANSNTASRARTSNLLHATGAGLAAAAGFGGHAAGLSPEAVIGSAVAAAALPRAVGEGLIRGRGYLGNTKLQGRQSLGATATRGLLTGFGQ